MEKTDAQMNIIVIKTTCEPVPYVTDSPYIYMYIYICMYIYIYIHIYLCVWAYVLIEKP